LNSHRIVPLYNEIQTCESPAPRITRVSTLDTNVWKSQSSEMLYKIVKCDLIKEL